MNDHIIGAMKRQIRINGIDEKAFVFVQLYTFKRPIKQWSALSGLLSPLVETKIHQVQDRKQIVPDLLSWGRQSVFWKSPLPADFVRLLESVQCGLRISQIVPFVIRQLLWSEISIEVTGHHGNSRSLLAEHSQWASVLNYSKPNKHVTSWGTVTAITSGNMLATPRSKVFCILVIDWDDPGTLCSRRIRRARAFQCSVKGEKQGFFARHWMKDNNSLNVTISVE